MFTRVQRHGVQMNGGTTRFNLWAPDAKSVALKLRESDELFPMQDQGDGWFNSHLECDADRKSVV